MAQLDTTHMVSPTCFLYRFHFSIRCTTRAKRHPKAQRLYSAYTSQQKVWGAQDRQRICGKPTKREQHGSVPQRPTVSPRSQLTRVEDNELRLPSSRAFRIQVACINLHSVGKPRQLVRRRLGDICWLPTKTKQDYLPHMVERRPACILAPLLPRWFDMPRKTLIILAPDVWWKTHAQSSFIIPFAFLGPS